MSQRLSLSFYSRKKTGSLITRVTADTDRLWEFLALGIVDVSLSLVMLVGLSAVLISERRATRKGQRDEGTEAQRDRGTAGLGDRGI